MIGVNFHNHGMPNTNTAIEPVTSTTTKPRNDPVARREEKEHEKQELQQTQATTNATVQTNAVSNSTSGGRREKTKGESNRRQKDWIAARKTTLVNSQRRWSWHRSDTQRTETPWVWHGVGSAIDLTKSMAVTAVVSDCFMDDLVFVKKSIKRKLLKQAPANKKITLG